MCLLLRRDAGELHQHRHHQPGHQPFQHIVEIPVGVFLQIPEQSLVQLLLVQGGLEIQVDVVVLLLKIPHVGAGAEDQRPGQAEVGEQQLPLLGVDRLFLPVSHLDGHVAQGQALHPGAEILLCHQGHQAGPGGQNGVPHAAGQRIAVAGGAGKRVGHPAGGDHRRPAGVKAVLPFHAQKDAVLPPQGHGPILHHGHPRPAQGAEQGVDDVGGLVRPGKDPVPPLRLQRNAQALKKRLHRLRREAGDGAGEESAVVGDVLEHLLHRAVVGHVAAALAGDVQLAPQLGVALQ